MQSGSWQVEDEYRFGQTGSEPSHEMMIWCLGQVAYASRHPSLNRTCSCAHSRTTDWLLPYGTLFVYRSLSPTSTFILSAKIQVLSSPFIECSYLSESPKECHPHHTSQLSHSVKRSESSIHTEPIKILPPTPMLPSRSNSIVALII